MKNLETERLILGDFEEDDIEEIYRLLFADEEVKKGWSGRKGTAEEIQEDFRRDHFYPEDNFGLRALVLKQEGDLIGLMGYQRHDPGEGESIWYLLSKNEPDRKVGFDPDYIEAELTYALGRPYWKKGYAIEMGRAMIEFGFEKLRIGRIIQGVRSWNSNSINLMKRLGFRIEECLDPEGVVGILDDYESWRETFAV